MNFLSFLKKYTLINDEFINDFYKLFDEKYIVLNNSFIINYELLIKWLDIKSKKSFVETLNNSY